jgi:SAM-dependent methyltransferase
VSTVPDSIAWYNDNATMLAPGYEAVASATAYGWLEPLLPPSPALALDVGAGTGRDAVWLSGLGYDIIAAEPSSGMRTEGERRHAGTRLRWIDDRLPVLTVVYRLSLAFDLILVSAVWQHIAPGEREQSMRRLLGLLQPGGILALTLRHGESETQRGMHPVSLPELTRLAQSYGAVVELVADLPDQLGRPGVTWTGVVLHLPAHRTGALRCRIAESAR